MKLGGKLLFDLLKTLRHKRPHQLHSKQLEEHKEAHFNRLYEIEHIPESEVSHYPESRTISTIPEYDALFKDGKESIHTFDSWRPYDLDWATYKQWQEIFNNMGVGEKLKYIDNICIELSIDDIGIDEFFSAHAIEPDIMWKCLILTI